MLPKRSVAGADCDGFAHENRALFSGSVITGSSVPEGTLGVFPKDKTEIISILD